MRKPFYRLEKRILMGIVLGMAAVTLAVVLSAKAAFAEPVRFGVYQGVQAALTYLADTQGFFKKRGLDVVTTEYEAGALAVNDLIAGKVDIAASGEFVFALQSLSHPDLRTPAAICSASDIEFVVRKDRGIERPEDLRGKRIGVLRRSGSEFFLYQFLIFNSIPAASVRIVDLIPSEMVKAITEGTIDAAVFGEPYTTEMAKRLAGKAARWPAQSGQDYYFILVVREDLLKKKPRQMEQFLAALSDAEVFMAKYPGGAQTILRKRLKMDDQSFLSVLSRSRLQLQLTQDLLVLLESEAKWAIRNKRVEKKEMPNYLDFLHLDALKKVKPEGVSVVH